MLVQGRAHRPQQAASSSILCLACTSYLPWLGDFGSFWMHTPSRSVNRPTRASPTTIPRVQLPLPPYIGRYKLPGATALETFALSSRRQKERLNKAQAITAGILLSRRPCPGTFVIASYLGSRRSSVVPSSRHPDTRTRHDFQRGSLAASPATTFRNNELN